MARRGKSYAQLRAERDRLNVKMREMRTRELKDAGSLMFEKLGVDSFEDFEAWVQQTPAEVFVFKAEAGDMSEADAKVEADARTDAAAPATGPAFSDS